jgi:F0F1-type ATP synthase assembly protein I
MAVVKKIKAKSKTKQKFDYQIISLALNLGFIIALPPIIGTFLGIYLDKLLNLKPILTISFIILGTVGGAYSAIKEAQKIVKQK